MKITYDSRKASKSFKAVGFLLLFIYVSFPSFLYSVVQGITQKPHELNFNTGEIRALETELEKENPDCSPHLNTLQNDLNRYYAQFVSQKRILDERRMERYAPDALDPNLVRLLSLIEKRRYGEIQYRGESPLMFRIHRALGRCYEKEENNKQALSHYFSALRYNTFETAFGDDLPPAELASLSEREVEEREKMFLHMLSIFAHPDRLKEEENNRFQDSGENFRSLLENYNTNKKAVEIAKRKIDAEIAKKARGKSGADPEKARVEHQTLFNEKKILFSDLETVRTGVYREYLTEKQNRDAALVFRIAGLVRETEQENKRLTALKNRNIPYREKGDLIEPDRTNFRFYTGYEIFLELAHKLDPNNLRYLELLAEQHALNRRNEHAIDLEENYIRMAEKIDTVPNENKARHYSILGRLYSNIKNRIKSADAYEKSLKLEPDSERRAVISYRLADIHFNYTGHFERAKELYEEYLKSVSTKDAMALDLRQRTDFHASRIRANKNLASIARRSYRSESENGYLRAARDEFTALETELKEIREKENAIQTDVNNLKRELFSREDEELQVRYYTLLKRDLPDIQEKAAFLDARIKSMNLPGVIERQAFIAFRERRMQEAKELYREIVLRGPSSHIERARKNLRFLNLIQESGAEQKLIPPPDHER